ncbi:helix-turn-helix domain-containing protein (plasmid) [Halolamina sp. CBA1230]|uniref:bacterio-opsin activator domain-containing protein n=1 Tax=Halolamina sp. CBA1230 TaxID=1853690 RepID=UPI001593322F|nr:bacterio-opsin activator domain-containing protein [Halolamina sp. CBA1230]QKY21794.1 helix-turn-helix domain-containing protein [Halolamina sp. CBA1230]
MDDQLRRAPIGVITVRDGVVAAANDAARKLLPGEDPDGKPIEGVFPQSVADSLPAAFEGRAVAEASFEEYYPTVDRWLSVSVVPDDGGATVYVDDVTERKRHEQARDRLRAERERVAVVDRLIADVLREFVDAASRAEITETIRERLGASDRYRFAWTAEHAGDGPVVEGVAGEEGETFPAVRAAIEDGDTTPEGRAVDRGRVQVVESMSDASSVPEPVRVAGFADGIQSVLAVPLSYGSSVYGVVGVYAGSEDAFTDHERSSFEALGELAGLAINATRNRRLLLSDTITEVTFELGTISPLAAVSERCGAALTLDGTVPEGDDGLHCFLTVTGADPDAVVDAATATPNVEAGRVVRRAEGEHGRIDLTLGGASPLVEAVSQGATIRTATFEGGTGEVVVELSPDADVRRLAVALGDGEPATVRSRRDRTRSPTTAREFRDELGERLTERQATVLRTAYLADYFESPRGSTAEEVAASLGITGSTLLHHLRASQRKLLDAFYDEFDDRKE